MIKDIGLDELCENCKEATKTLGCWCKPKSCHGDILLELANQKTEKLF